jgi:hypothetical protein
MSCVPPSSWTVAEWTVDTDPSVMETKAQEFSWPKLLFVFSYMEFREGGIPLPAEFFFPVHGNLRQV